MAIIVQKYGGTSVGSIDRIKKVAEKIIAKKNKGHKMIIVVSAMSDTTDKILDMANSVNHCPDSRELDVITAAGEMISSSLLAVTLQALGQDAISYTASQIAGNNAGTQNKPHFCGIDEKKISEALNRNQIVIVAGFQGIDKYGDIPNFTKGGADITAVTLAAKLDGICEMYMDVEGIYTVDPNLYKYSKKLDTVSYEEMLELASLGTTIINSHAIELAEKFNVPVYIAHCEKDKKGTYIKEVEVMEHKPITGIAISDSDAIITLEGIPFSLNTLADIFDCIAEQQISVDMISQTAPIGGNVHVSFTVPKKDLSSCKSILNDLIPGVKMTIDEEITKFSVVGMGMKSASGVASRLFKLLSLNNIQIKMVTTSEIRITCAINNNDKLKAVQVAAREFGL